MFQHHNESESPVAVSTPFRFPQIPLVSGDTAHDADGNERAIKNVSVLITTADSATPIEVKLEYRFGGWWAPAQV